jgi:hypothetical protein
MKHLKKFKLFENENQSSEKEITLYIDWCSFDCILIEKDGVKTLKTLDGKNLEKEFVSNRFDDIEEVFSEYADRFPNKDNDSRASCKKTGLTVLGGRDGNPDHNVTVADGEIDEKSPDIKFYSYEEDSVEGCCEINIHSINNAIKNGKLILVKEEDLDDEYKLELPTVNM